MPVSTALYVGSYPGGVPVPWQFWVDDPAYGAKGDGTNDTPAINAAVTAAVNYALTHNHYAEVCFSDKTYTVSSPTIKGGTTKGNAQIPLPVIDPTAHKLTIVFRGVGDAAALPHWSQTVPQASGTVLKTTLLGQAYDATYGFPSVIGGPTQEQGFAVGSANLWSNMLVVVDGVMIQAPANPTIDGFFFSCVAEANVINAACQANQIPANATTPTNAATGLTMPFNGNNDYAEVGQWSCEGFYQSIALGEHSHVQSMRSIYCNIGLGVIGSNRHSILVAYASIEACTRSIVYSSVPVPYPATSAQIRVLQMDVELSPTIDDPTNMLVGEVWYNPNSMDVPSDTPIQRNGATGLKIINMTQRTGLVTAPAMPASNTALLNPIDRDCAVTVSGGTVSAIKVDGQSLGVTSGTVTVPANKTITLTYTAPPSWVWIAL